MTNIITKQQISSIITEEYRHFFDLRFDTATYDLIIPFKLLAEAINLFCQYANINKKAELFFNTGNTGVLHSPNILIQYEISSAIHIHYNHCIFFNISQSSRYDQRMQIAMYLEELAHCYMNIQDEILVKKVVSAMYPAVKYNEQTDQYELNE